MVKKEPFFFMSSNSVTEICGMKWIPESEINAVLQVCHGMAEHILRYDKFATYLAEHGVLVFMIDLVGHGHTALRDSDLGYFGDYLVNSRLVEDMFRAKCIIQKEFGQHYPFFVLGHSMGSVLVREYMLTHKEQLDGVALIGCVDYSKFKCYWGKALAKLISLCHKERMRYRSPLVHHLGAGSFDRPFAKEGIRNAWLTRDRTEIERFNQDPRCDFVSTIGLYRDILDGVLFAQDKKKLERFPKNIPILILGGTQDSAGEFGKAPKKLYNVYKSYGFDVMLHMYKGARHELLHETNKEKVFEDILGWIYYAIYGDELAELSGQT